MFDHIALGIVLPGPLTKREKRAFLGWKVKRINVLRCGGNPRDLQQSTHIVDAAFDDFPRPVDALALPAEEARE